MLLSELMKVIDYKEVINRSGIKKDSLSVLSLCSDSRKAVADSMFVCISGSMSDGHAYAGAAYNEGCRIFVAEHDPKLPDDAFVIITSDTRIALAKLSAHFFGDPAKEMTVIGITGTKGKTTSSLLIYNILNESGIRSPAQWDRRQQEYPALRGTKILTFSYLCLHDGVGGHILFFFLALLKELFSQVGECNVGKHIFIAAGNAGKLFPGGLYNGS